MTIKSAVLGIYALASLIPDTEVANEGLKFLHGALDPSSEVLFNQPLPKVDDKVSIDRICHMHTVRRIDTKQVVQEYLYSVVDYQTAIVDGKKAHIVANYDHAHYPGGQKTYEIMVIEDGSSNERKKIYMTHSMHLPQDNPLRPFLETIWVSGEIDHLSDIIEQHNDEGNKADPNRNCSAKKEI